jgi:hypothetical protein
LHAKCVESRFYVFINPTRAFHARTFAGAARLKLRLTRKFAECIDGVDLSQVRPGDIIDVPAREAAMLLAERWAVRARTVEPREKAADRRRPPRPPRP